MSYIGIVYAFSYRIVSLDSPAILGLCSTLSKPQRLH